MSPIFLCDNLARPGPAPTIASTEIQINTTFQIPIVNRNSIWIWLNYFGLDISFVKIRWTLNFYPYRNHETIITWYTSSIIFGMYNDLKTIRCFLLLFWWGGGLVEHLNWQTVHYHYLFYFTWLQKQWKLV